MQLQQIVQSIPDNYYDELAVQALQKHRNERTAVEIFYMTKYFRQFHFFYGYSDDVVKDCCSKMRYEVLNKCFLIYKRFEQIQEDTKKLYIILQGELGVYLSKGLLPENWKDVEYDQVCTIKSYQHFGNQLFQMTKDDIHEQFGLIIRPKRLTCAATINYQFFQAYLLQLEQRKLSYEISRLYDYPVFSGIQYKELKKFYINCYKYRYNYMEKVYNQGDGAFCVHFIVKGNFSLKRTIDNETISLGILSDGEVIGEHEIITNCESRPFSVTCISESGELIACDAQFFQGYVYDLIRENIEQAIEAKTKFHQLEKTSIKQELNQLHSLVVKRTSFSEICKQNKTHYPVNPKRKKTTHTTHEYKGKQSYYDLFMDIYDTASKQTKLADDDRQRRITHYVKNTLKPMQQKLKHSLNISANKTDESVNKNNAMPLHNEILIQALSRKTDSRFRRTFQKTKSLASLSPVKKSLPEIPTVDLGQHFFVKKQYQSREKLIYNIQ